MLQRDSLRSLSPVRIYYLLVVNLGWVRPVLATDEPLVLPQSRAVAPSSDAADARAPLAEQTWGTSTHTNPVPLAEDKRPPSSDYSTKTADIVAVEAHNSTYIPLFQRALLPGPAGSIITPETVLPVYDYLMIRVLDADVPWAKNSLDMELSLWGSGTFVGTRERNRTFDGDVSVANVTQRFGLNYVKLGRQYVTEGAARF